MKFYAVCRPDGVMVSKLYSRKGDAKRVLMRFIGYKGYENSFVQTYELVPVAEA